MKKHLHLFKCLFNFLVENGGYASVSFKGQSQSENGIMLFFEGQF